MLFTQLEFNLILTSSLAVIVTFWGNLSPLLDFNDSTRFGLVVFLPLDYIFFDEALVNPNYSFEDINDHFGVGNLFFRERVDGLVVL